ncbi:precorrin-6y C5,15-methyltransferase (decarboxylating) subunit CbiE [Anoxybacterium hadale]|uniref:Precorrin-6y C5,15-methyltransferase (Decarboxylating) subunit CbiE n=1 Tax=Anoxybacterium hadale TaxID=3408580 RepID=A0ACD1AAW1_9FIRM|nr:precorrin-6y C5,15-methyltransferase (decarboxylating) subunit CbiE [Clostridiales bacterium]
MKRIYLVGIGMGNIETITDQGRKAVEKSQVLIGAERMIQAFPDYQGEVCYAIAPARILEYLSSHQDWDTAAVIFSGDTGFYSGAKKLNEAIETRKGNCSGSVIADAMIADTESLAEADFWNECRVEFIPGISSLQYFCAKLKLPWEDVKIVSLHGREANLLGAIFNHNKVFFLTGGDYPVRRICEILTDHSLGEVKVSVGERLSYPNEKIERGTARELSAKDFDPLSVMIVENQKLIHRETETHGLSDDLFVRGAVPMTKSEIRSISLSKLELRKTDVIYDIGAGTGSVAVEMALTAREGAVFAVECNEEAIGLIKTNAEQMGAWNLRVIPGMAPEALTSLPPPDRAFIGGSKGNLAAILEVLIQKNPKIRVVINAITLETVSEALNQLSRLGFEGVDIVQIFAAHGKAAGNSHLMMGQNPVFIISGEMRETNLPND